MTLWISLAVMTALAALFVLWPLSRRSALQSAVNDLDVYRAQLTELDHERQLGRISEIEADAARVELSRRLLLASEKNESSLTEVPLRRRLTSLLPFVVIPAIAYGFYGLNGSPAVPPQPLAARLDSAMANKDMPAMVAKVESHLKSNPDDVKGWELLAPIYTRMGRFDEALKARKELLRLSGASAERYSDIGELYVVRDDGQVNDEALLAFQSALAIDAKHPKALFFTGLAAAQSGDKDKARSIWASVIANSEPDAPWVPFMKAQISALDAPAQPAQGPQSEAGKQIQSMAPADQQAAIRTMVDGLAQKLAVDGSDLNGWLRLIRAYVVLNDQPKALQAFRNAQNAFAGKPEAQVQLLQLATELKLAKE